MSQVYSFLQHKYSRWVFELNLYKVIRVEDRTALTHGNLWQGKWNWGDWGTLNTKQLTQNVTYVLNHLFHGEKIKNRKRERRDSLLFTISLFKSPWGWGSSRTRYFIWASYVGGRDTGMSSPSVLISWKTYSQKNEIRGRKRGKNSSPATLIGDAGWHKVC